MSFYIFMHLYALEIRLNSILPLNIAKFLLQIQKSSETRTKLPRHNMSHLECEDTRCLQRF